MEKEQNELVSVVDGFALSDVKVKEFNDLVNSLIKQEEKWNELSLVDVEDENDEQGMELAKKNRLAIRRERIDAEKFLKSKRDELAELMKVYKDEDDLVRKITQLVSAKAKAYEEGLKAKEDFAENLKLKAEEELLAKRTLEIQDYCDNPSIYNLGQMTETVYQITLSHLKAEKEKQSSVELSVKETLEMFINSFSYNEVSLTDEKGMELHNDILCKFDGFKKWAKAEIDKL